MLLLLVLLSASDGLSTGNRSGACGGRSHQRPHYAQCSPLRYCETVGAVGLGSQACFCVRIFDVLQSFRLLKRVPKPLQSTILKSFHLDTEFESQSAQKMWPQDVSVCSSVLQYRSLTCLWHDNVGDIGDAKRRTPLPRREDTSPRGGNEIIYIRKHVQTT